MKFYYLLLVSISVIAFPSFGAGSGYVCKTPLVEKDADGVEKPLKNIITIKIPNWSEDKDGDVSLGEGAEITRNFLIPVSGGERKTNTAKLKKVTNFGGLPVIESDKDTQGEVYLIVFYNRITSMRASVFAESDSSLKGHDIACELVLN